MRRFALPVCLLAYVALSLRLLLDYPPVYADEPWMLSSPIHLLRTGHHELPMFGEAYTPALYYNLYMAAALRVLGVSMTAARLFSVLHGAALLALAYALAARFDRRAAWVAPIALLTAFPFFGVSQYVRPDIIEVTYGVLALYLYAAGRQSGGRLLFGSGISAGLAVGIFLRGIWIPIVLSAWIAMDRRLLRRRAMLTVLGFLAGLVPMAIFIATTWDRYWDFLRRFGGSSVFGLMTRAGSPLEAVWSIMLAESQRYEALLAATGSPFYVASLALLYGTSLVVAARSHPRVVLGAVLPLACLALLAANKSTAYFLVALPGMAVATALAARRVPHVMGVFLALNMIAFALLIQGAMSLPRFAERQAVYDTVRFAPDALIISEPTVYAHLLHRPGVSFRSLHWFTDKDFSLRTYRENSCLLKRLAASRPVYHVYQPAAFFVTMQQFEKAPGRVAELRSLVEDDFRIVRRIDIHRDGASDVLITRYRGTPTTGERPSCQQFTPGS